MKKIVASVGLVAFGVSGLQAEQPAITSQAAKPWSISATLRGFYDDNPNASTSEANKTDSFGVELSPSVGLNWGNGQTTVLAKYTYSLKWYDKPIGGGLGRTSQQHLFDLALGHAFSERYSLEVDNTFAIGQEPDTLRAGNTFTGLQPVSGNNIRNSGLIRFNAELTPELSLELGYINNFFDYSDELVTTSGIPGTLSESINASRSGALDRIEQTGYIKARWQLTPETTPFASYKFRMVNFTSDQIVELSPVFTTVGTNVVFDHSDPVFAKDRDRRSHIITAGVDHEFRPDLTGSAEAGVEYTEHPNDPASQSDLSPYVSAGLRYVYLPSSALSIGFQYLHAETEVLSSGDHLVSDSQVAVLYGVITHQIFARLYASGSFTWQYATFNESGRQVTTPFANPTTLDSQTFYLFDAKLEYRFNPYLSAHVGYSFDREESNLGDFSRNRVYIGATASY